MSLSDWLAAVSASIDGRLRRYGHLTMRRDDDGTRVLEVLVLNLESGSVEILSTRVPGGVSDFPSMTNEVPAAHWAERLVGDLWGLRAVGHPRWKSIVLHEPWPEDLFPRASREDGAPSPRTVHFQRVAGEGVHEIPVGPIHAGIIEPGHFRFSCIGEVIANLEIRLGYQHRGVEATLEKIPWRHARYVAESASSDSTVANALAHAQAIEDLCDVEPPPRAKGIRAVALETERLANHLGDLGGLAADIGFGVGAAAFARLRGAALGLAQRISGSRFQRGFVRPGGLAWDVSEADLGAYGRGLADLGKPIEEAIELFFQNPGVQERMQGVGVLQPSLAEEFGMVGPAARASASEYDARRHFGVGAGASFTAARQTAGDAYARAAIRREEIFDSVRGIQKALEKIPDSPFQVDMPLTLPSGAVAVAIVESWRGELIHWITTDPQGSISRYAIRDPSFQNWTGLAIAARKNLVADFPLINKSFSLSYSGNDL